MTASRSPPLSMIHALPREITMLLGRADPRLTALTMTGVSVRSVVEPPVLVDPPVPSPSLPPPSASAAITASAMIGTAARAHTHGGKYRPGEPSPEGSRAQSRDMSRFIGQWLHRPTLDAVARLEPVAEEAGLTMSQLALAWVLRRDEVAAAIVGASRPEQVHENAAAADVTLSDEVLRAVDEALLLVAVT